jgi:hypothetical protein
LLPKTRRRGYALSKKGAVEWALFTCKQAQRDQRLAAVKRLPPKMPPSVLQTNHGPGTCLTRVQDVGAVNPQMS